MPTPSGTDLILPAMAAIDAHSAIRPASDESLEYGRNELNSMVSSWADDGIEMGFIVIQKASAETGIPESARSAIIFNLAIRLFPYLKSASTSPAPHLIGLALSGYNRIRRSYQKKAIPKPIVSGTMPLGAGNQRCWEGNQNRTFAGEDFVLSDGVSKSSSILTNGN